MNILLASASPRREELLRQIGCSFNVFPSDVVENNDRDVSIPELTMTHAKEKAVDVATKNDEDSIIIGADTIVVLDGQVFGKPKDETDARCMLSRLEGREHQVITGIAVAHGPEVWTDYCITTVKMKHLSTIEIDRYVASGEPFDKAGAYAIQGLGALLVEKIAGCYFNVVGLPLVTLDRLMRKSVGLGLV